MFLYTQLLLEQGANERKIRSIRPRSQKLLSSFVVSSSPLNLFSPFFVSLPTYTSVLYFVIGAIAAAALVARRPYIKLGCYWLHIREGGGGEFAAAFRSEWKTKPSKWRQLRSYKVDRRRHTAGILRVKLSPLRPPPREIEIKKGSPLVVVSCCCSPLMVAPNWCPLKEQKGTKFRQVGF